MGTSVDTLPYKPISVATITLWAINNVSFANCIAGPITIWTPHYFITNKPPMIPAIAFRSIANYAPVTGSPLTGAVRTDPVVITLGKPISISTVAFWSISYKPCCNVCKAKYCFHQYLSIMVPNIILYTFLDNTPQDIVLREVPKYLYVFSNSRTSSLRQTLPTHKLWSWF